MNYFFSCKQFVAVMLATGLCCFAAMAQEQAPSAMTLHDCMEYAVSNSTKMRIQQAAIGDAQIDRRDAALKLFTPPSGRAGAEGPCRCDPYKDIDRVSTIRTWYSQQGAEHDYGQVSGAVAVGFMEEVPGEKVITSGYDSFSDNEVLILQ